MLLHKWETGATYWKRLSNTEFEELRQKRNKELEQGEIGEPSRQIRSDKGKKCTRQPNTSDENGRKRKKQKSSDNADDKIEDVMDDGNGDTATQDPSTTTSGEDNGSQLADRTPSHVSPDNNNSSIDRYEATGAQDPATITSR
jgi:hypothetical protein